MESKASASLISGTQTASTERELGSIGSTRRATASVGSQIERTDRRFYMLLISVVASSSD